MNIDFSSLNIQLQPEDILHGATLDTAPPIATEATTATSTALAGRSVANGSGEDKKLAYSARETIKNILSGISKALMAIVLSPVALAKGIHTYVIKPCVEEFKSMLDDANSDGRPRVAPQRSQNISALDKFSQSFNNGINEKVGYKPPAEPAR